MRPVAVNAPPRGWRPATLALVILLASVLLAFTIGQLLIALGLPAPGGYALLALQSGLALWLAVLLRMERWWRPILLLFLPAVVLLRQVALPPWLYLVAFLLTLGLFWTTFRTRVPLYPSTPAVWRRVDAFLGERRVRLLDVGSGLGGLVLYLAGRRPVDVCCGVEIAPLPWLVSRVRARLRRAGNASFVRKRYETLDFAAFDVVFAYLSPVAMTALWRQASAQMRPGSVLLSHAFDVPGVPPDAVLDVGAGEAAIYVWRF